MIPVTRKMLQDWAGEAAFREGEAIFNRGFVAGVEVNGSTVKGVVAAGGRCMRSSFKLTDDGLVENLCPCRDSVERGLVCAHVVALGMALCRKAVSPERERLRREEAAKAQRLAAMDGAAYLRRVPANFPGSVKAELRILLNSRWPQEWASGRVSAACLVELEGGARPPESVPADKPLAFSSRAEALLYMLEDAIEGPLRGRFELSRPDFLNLLSLHCGKPLLLEDGAGALTVNSAPMSSMLVLNLMPDSGEIIVKLHTELPFLREGDAPVYLVCRRSGWVFGAGNFWPLESVLPEQFHSVYEADARISRSDVPRFIKTELPLLSKHIRIQSDVTEDMFVFEPASPQFRLIARGSPASLSFELRAQYGPLDLPAGRPDPAGHFALPEPSDILKYQVRNMAAESAALARLEQTGVQPAAAPGRYEMVGWRETLNFIGGAMPALRREGWKIEFCGSIAEMVEGADFVTPVVRIAPAPGMDWFEVVFEFEDGRGGALAPAEVQRAILKGDCFIERDGKPVFLDVSAINAVRETLADCEAGEGASAGALRINSVYAAYLKASLDAVDGVDVAAPPEWLEMASLHNRGRALERLALPETLDKTLRRYQKEGVQWLRFLEANRFAGILADEMGLGKTVQTLAWLALRRCRAKAVGRPALIVCPTSLVENWLEEAARFVPELRAMAVVGPDRGEKWKQADGFDILVTSYAILRRDTELLDESLFSAVVLDEAQHIKNRATRNALAAKRLKTVHRLVLTGTPMENSLSDLWSIMDFLMPAYLGGHEQFRQRYELPVNRGGADAEAALQRLRRKIRPFMLRRLKQEVAAELPAKITKIAFCTLSPDQSAVYRELATSSARRISDMVTRDGFNRSRMEILKTLMRLRQVCCHLELLKLDGLRAAEPSAKTELFFELLDEALDGGHRVLVFSQFVSMLHILRRELERRDIRYCYLDGATRERLKVVREFNTNKEFPVFLISLKAGGSGLNLTGADMVIHFDPWWNPAVEDQATDRAHRIGQKRTVYCAKLIARGTVEEKVLKLQERKRALIEAAVVSDSDFIRTLTWEDVQELLQI